MKIKFFFASNTQKQLMREIEPALTHPCPRLRLVQPVGYTGGPEGHFQTLMLKNFDTDPAFDLKCWMEGFGFHAVLSNQTAGSFIDGGKEKGYKFQLDGLEICNRDIQLLNFYASYSNLDGQRIQYKSSLTQKNTPGKTFKVLDLGTHHSYSKLLTDVEIDKMSLFELTGDNRSAEFEVGKDRFKVTVSNRLLALWHIEGQWIEHCLRQLGKASLKIMSSLRIFQDKVYISTGLPSECQNGFDGFVKTPELIESGKY